MSRCVLVVPGWPTAKNPGRLPFLRDFANAIVRKTPVTVVVLDSLGGALRRGEIFTQHGSPEGQNYQVLRVPLLNLRIDVLIRLQLWVWANIIAWRFRLCDVTWVNSHFNEVGPFGRQLAAKLGARHIVTEHASNFYRAMPRSGSSRKARIMMLKEADTVVAVGPQLADAITRDTGIARSEIKVIGNGIDDIAAVVPTGELKRNSQAIRFIFVGHLITRKRVEQLVKTFNRLEVTRPIELEIIGDGPLKRDVLSLIKKGKKYGRRLNYLGQLEKPEVMLHVRQADFLVLPSEYESFGIVAAEALTQGTACLVSRCGGPEFFVRDGIDGFHFDVDDFDALARLMTAAAEGKIAFDRNNLRAKNEGRFSWDTVSQKYILLVEDQW